MGLNYIASGKIYNISGNEYTTVSDKKHRLNYIASGQVHELGLTTDSTASKYSPLRIKVENSTYYIGRSQSSSTSYQTTLSTKSSSSYNTYRTTEMNYTYNAYKISITKEIRYNSDFDKHGNVTNTSSDSFTVNRTTYYVPSDPYGFKTNSADNFVGSDGSGSAEEYYFYYDYIDETRNGYPVNTTERSYHYTQSSSKITIVSSSASSHNFV